MDSFVVGDYGYATKADQGAILPDALYARNWVVKAIKVIQFWGENKIFRFTQIKTFF